MNALPPGLIDTEMRMSSGTPDRVNRVLSTVPMDRVSSAAKVAEAAFGRFLTAPAKLPARSGRSAAGGSDQTRKTSTPRAPSGAIIAGVAPVSVMMRRTCGAGQISAGSIRSNLEWSATIQTSRACSSITRFT